MSDQTPTEPQRNPELEGLRNIATTIAWDPWTPAAVYGDEWLELATVKLRRGEPIPPRGNEQAETG